MLSRPAEEGSDTAGDTLVKPRYIDGTESEPKTFGNPLSRSPGR
jgi:hypothetical protein